MTTSVPVVHLGAGVLRPTHAPPAPERRPLLRREHHGAPHRSPVHRLHPLAHTSAAQLDLLSGLAAVDPHR
eukprot:368361-Pyramimonas_sp.AAC.2